MTRAPLALALLLGLLAGCSAPAAQDPPTQPAPTSAPAPTAAPSATATPTPTPTPTPTKKAPARKVNPISMQALIQKRYDGRDLERGRLLRDQGSYKRYAVTFRGDGETISGIMNVPDGRGPFPVVVLNHGYIDPDTYWSGQGMPREQDVLARRGFAVLHVDYQIGRAHV